MRTRMRTMFRCRICNQRLDPVWHEIGEDTHPSCEKQEACPHGEPRGSMACPLCRRSLGLVHASKTERPSVERNVVSVGTSHPATSKIAAARVLPATGTKRRLVYEAIRQSIFGMCDWELEQKFQWKHESLSACRRSLVVDGWVVDSGMTRPVPDTGNEAIVWITVD